MKFEGTETWGWINAVIGMRLPKSKDYEDAKSKIDSFMVPTEKGLKVELGPSDLKLLKALIGHDDSGKSGQPNSKALRMIHVQVAVTAPLAWWKEADTYKVGTVSNSTSTMHKIQAYEITEDSFEKNPLTGQVSSLLNIMALEDKRKEYNILQAKATSLAEKGYLEEAKQIKTEQKSTWYDIIYGLGDSWLQTRMFDLNYTVLRDMVFWRQAHKQNCWSGKDNPEMDNFLEWARTLPYAEELLF